MANLDDLANAVQSRQDGPRSNRRPPYYGGIVFGALVIRIISIPFFIVGVIALAFFVADCVNRCRHIPERGTWTLATFMDAQMLALSLGILAVASIISMLAWLALAIRDIAINSHYR